MVSDSDTYPEGTVVRIKKTGQLAIIKKRQFLKNGRNFMHYLAEIEEREGLYCVFHEDIEVEALPK